MVLAQPIAPTATTMAIARGIEEDGHPLLFLCIARLHSRDWLLGKADKSEWAYQNWA